MKMNHIYKQSASKYRANKCSSESEEPDDVNVQNTNLSYVKWTSKNIRPIIHDFTQDWNVRTSIILFHKQQFYNVQVTTILIDQSLQPFASHGNFRSSTKLPLALFSKEAFSDKQWVVEQFSWFSRWGVVIQIKWFKLFFVFFYVS